MTKTKGNNPGNNLKGQLPRAINHHVGPVKIEYIEDATKRAQALSKRKGTLFKKMEQLSKITKTEFVCKWKSPSGSSGVFRSDGNGSTETDKEITATDINNERDTESVTAPVEEDDQDTEPSYPAPVMVPTDDEDNTEEGSNKTKCDICHKENISKKKNEVWLNCEYRKGCNFWAHTLCVGIVVKRDRDLDEVKFYCPEHIRSFMK